ncbi:type III-A CRISPR-associated protein Cas10/Csm1 [Thermococcus chitonophagus]|uniref:CRISPR system single-strand-specific deoxyribonuclease Cas10/Csm1 (subtype III-A) n=1 Tax=Thermococcus chitonophagus TaxID=54262 RepID=A0A160VTP7_9EURY|nr:type III-A CRISPR-associated protein Cas10/Csm1 [Thermococcus chitonophagus]ASJ15747.1 type III-A CRISPR-associated protein Cas10/Csm1 [Thermococcus chitonophagus]CUX76971.1 CRISPR-associated protein, Csm1 family [Thermococcus chitonophagus]
MDIRDLIALGGLLHDIGKPVQRARLYNGDHSIQGHNFLLDLAEKTGVKEYEILALFSRFHHKKYMEEVRELNIPNDIKIALYVVYVADNISSKEREEEKGYDIRRPLKSVFNRNLGYPLYELNLETLPIPGEVDGITSEEYRKLVKALKEDLKKVELRVDKVMPILEKHLTFVSSVTTENNVISLYDHLKMTSAIALALYNAGCRPGSVEEAERCMREKNLLLVEGDFSGIQNFIYSVSGKGTLKYLRARSAYLELIGWDIVLKIIEDLDLTLANVVFNAGGHFMIIAQNTKGARNKLEDIRRKVTEWLWKKFEGRLYIGIDWEECTGEELMKDFNKVRGRLKKKVTIRKLKRFEFVNNVFTVGDRGRLEECQICGVEVPEEELKELGFEDGEVAKVCETCHALWFLGEKLIKMEKGLVLTDKITGEGIPGPFSEFLPYEGQLQGKYLLMKNTFSPPRTDMVFVPYIVADYYREKEGRVINFNELAEESVGAKRIGVIKGDVDKLGEYFANRKSISEYATASRFMDYFFKFYLKGVIRGYYSDIIGEVPSLGEWKENPNVVVVYAGGDDFLIVGSWNEIFELAFRIREAFRKYTGEGLTISIALGYFHSKTPIYRIADVMTERLEKAKEEGRDAIYVIERTGWRISYPWDIYMDFWREIGRKVYSDGRLTGKFRDKKGLLHKVLELRELYVRDPKDVRWAYLLAYHLSRHEVEEVFRKILGIDSKTLEEEKPQPIYWVDGILKVILMAVRG